MTTTTTPPPPLKWHPAYDGHPRLLDWLNDRGPYAGRDSVKVPRRTRPRMAWTADPSELWAADSTPWVFVLTRRKAVGRAPYVGDPFHYQWWVARDQLGRSIAGDAWIVRH